MMKGLLDAVARWLERILRGDMPEPVALPVPVHTPRRRR